MEPETGLVTDILLNYALFMAGGLQTNVNPTSKKKRMQQFL